MNSNDGSLQTFGLRLQSDARRGTYSSIRMAMVVVSAMFALVLGLILSAALTSGGLSTSLEWTQLLVLVPGLACMIGMMLVAVYKLGPGATSLTVDSGGLQFTWPSGRTERLPWSRTTRGFTLLDYTVVPAIPRLTGVSWELRRRNRPASYLSEQAFKAVIKGAEDQGIKVSSTLPSATDFRHNFWGWARCRIITFDTRA
jgi:hypothetical protein